MRGDVIFKVSVIGVLFIVGVYWVNSMIELKLERRLWDVFSKEKVKATFTVAAATTKGKCGRAEACPPGHLAFRMASGENTFIGPHICIEDRIVMDGNLYNVGLGLNVAVVNGATGAVIHTEVFDTFEGDITELINLLKIVTDGSLLLIASFDEPASKLNAEARNMFAAMGSRFIKNVAYRDTWVFVGTKGNANSSLFEAHTKNNEETNKYQGWPERVEIDGCIPLRKSGGVTL
ncbi:protein FAM3C-like isoform X1 [Lampetra planeri]